MRVVILSTYFAPAFLAGGPVQTLSAMVKNAPDGVVVDVVTTNLDHGIADILPVPTGSWTKWNRANVLYTNGRLRSILRALRQVSGRHPDYVYVNSLFDPRFSLLPQMLARLGLFRSAQIVLAPRGELNEGALALKWTKKQVFLALYRTLGLARGVIWHASTEHEAQDIRREFGGQTGIIVRRNDTMLPNVPRRRRQRAAGPCRLLFASRLSAKKRLDLLLESLRYVHQDCELMVVGAFDDPDYEKRCRDLVNTYELQGRVLFAGPSSREGVLGAMTQADVFVFPTAGENFGHVIAEALSVACPVIVSRHTPWSDTLASGGGVVVEEDTARAFGDAIDEFVSRGSDGWSLAAHAAGEAYIRWRGQTEPPHLFEILRSARVDLRASGP